MRNKLFQVTQTTLAAASNSNLSIARTNVAEALKLAKEIAHTNARGGRTTTREFDMLKASLSIALQKIEKTINPSADSTPQNKL